MQNGLECSFKGLFSLCTHSQIQNIMIWNHHYLSIFTIIPNSSWSWSEIMTICHSYIMYLDSPTVSLILKVGQKLILTPVQCPKEFRSPTHQKKVSRKKNYKKTNLLFTLSWKVALLPWARVRDQANQNLQNHQHSWISQFFNPETNTSTNTNTNTNPYTKHKVIHKYSCQGLDSGSRPTKISQTSSTVGSAHFSNQIQIKVCIPPKEEAFASKACGINICSDVRSNRKWHQLIRITIIMTSWQFIRFN